MEYLPNFKLYRPNTAKDAIKIMTEMSDVRYVAGGTDMIVNVRIKETDPIWSEEWAKKTGLPFDGNGNGQSDDDAQKVTISSMENFIQYQELVWQSTADLLESITDADLSKEVKARTGTEQIDESISLHMLGHFNGHRGEMNFLRGMQGMDPLLVREGTH